MTKKKTIGMSLGVWGIVLAVYHLLVFLFIPPLTAVFWMSYGFMLIAFGLQIVGMYLSFRELSVEAAFFGIPLAQFTLYYFFAELFMSIVFMIFQIVTWIIPLFLQALLLAIYGVVAIVSVGARDASVAKTTQVQSATAVHRLQAGEVEMLIREVSDPGLQRRLRDLADTVRYSDPITHPAVQELENQIQREMVLLHQHCITGDVAAASVSCGVMKQLYERRNQTLLANK